MSIDVVRQKLVTACLRRLGSERDEPHSSYDAELEYCDDEIDRLAQELTEAIHATPS